MKEVKKSFLAELSEDAKQYGYINHIITLFFTIFFLHISRRLQLELSIFTFFYWYIVCLLMGHFAVHNVGMYKGKKWKYKKSKNDTYFAIPFAGGVNLVTFAVPVLIADYFFKFL